MATQKARLKKSPFKINVSDYYGSCVFCSTERWENHILGRSVGIPHPELAGREDEVKKALQNPDRIVPSKRKRGPSKDELGFEHNTANDTIRVWVRYDDPTRRFTGTTTGYISTGYVVSPAYSSQVGAPIYIKGSAPTRKGETK